MIIGIDPDTKLSGVAFYEDKFTGLEIMNLYDLLQMLDHTKPGMVCISAGWLNKIVNFQDRKASVAVRERISERIGANHEIGKQIAAFCANKGIPYTLVRPRGKKLNGSQFNRLTGCQLRSNQETRDAAMTVFAYLNRL